MAAALEAPTEESAPPQLQEQVQEIRAWPKKNPVKSVNL